MWTAFLSSLVAVLAFMCGFMAVKADQNRRRLREARRDADRWQERGRSEREDADILRLMIERLPAELRRRIGTTLNAADAGTLYPPHRDITLEDMFPSWWLCEVLNSRGVDVTVTTTDQTHVIPVTIADKYTVDGEFVDPELEREFQAWLRSPGGRPFSHMDDQGVRVGWKRGELPSQ